MLGAVARLGHATRPGNPWEKKKDGSPKTNVGDDESLVDARGRLWGMTGGEGCRMWISIGKGGMGVSGDRIL